MSSLTSQVLTSSFLLLLIRIIQRGIGLISTLILARVLTPDDFGIVAIAALVIHFCEVLSEAGSQQYIVQKDVVDEDDINSAWTLDIILKSILWFLLILLIPTISSFYERPEIENVLYASSTILLIGAFKSPGLLLLKRALKYKPIFKISVLQKLISFSIVMAIIYFEPTYWALIYGDIASALTLTFGSYFVYSMKPRISLKKVTEQWSFSQWILLKGGVGFSRAEADTMLVSKFYSAADLGAYHLSKHLSIMPSTDIIGPAIEPLLASYARVKNQPEKLAYQLSLSMLVVCLLIAPVSSFMWFFPELIIDFFLGKQWTEAYPLLSALSILLFTIVISQVVSQYCVALGRVRALFVYDLLSLIFIFSVLFLFHAETLHDFALLRGILGLAMTILFFIYIRYVSATSIRHILKRVLPVLFAAFTAGLTLELLAPDKIGWVIVDLSYYLSVYMLIYTFMIVTFFILYYRNTQEGLHLVRLLLALLAKGKQRLGLST